MASTCAISSEGREVLQSKYIQIPKLKLKPIQRIQRTEQDNCDQKILNLFKANFYDSELQLKKGEIVNRIIMQNYPQFEKKTIYSSLIGQRHGIYDHIRKAMRFWSCFCNYSFPIVQKEKYGISKKINNNNHQNTVKLPKLYTNSSKESRLNQSTIHVKKVKSVMDIFTKNYVI